MQIENFAQKLQAFIQEREWERFHTPKNLAMSISIEANELLEEFLWLTDETPLSEERMERIRDEMGDVFITLLTLSQKLGIDLLEASEQKLQKIGQKYPIDKSKGNSLKYTEFA